MYNENYIIKKFGHIKNTPLRLISTDDLKKLIEKLAHDKLLVKAMKDVIFKREHINVQDELKKLEEEEFKNKETIPKNIILSENMRQYALNNDIKYNNIDILFNEFCQYYTTKGYKSRDWNKLWNSWVDKNIGYVPKIDLKEKRPLPCSLNFTLPINGEKYPRIFLNDRDYYIAESISNNIENILFDANIQIEDFDKVPGIGYQKCKHPSRGERKLYYFIDDDIDDMIFKSKLKVIENDTLSVNKFNRLKKYSDYAKSILNELNIDWYNDYYINNKTLTTKQGDILSFHNILNPTTNNQEIIIKKISPQGK